MPESSALAALRRDIDRRPHRIKRVLTDAGLRKEFFGGIADDEKKAVRAFVSQSAENALKRKPKVSRKHFLHHQHRASVERLGGVSSLLLCWISRNLDESIAASTPGGIAAASVYRATKAKS